MAYLIYVKGIVQGVGFRPFVYRLARGLGLKGYVKNLGDAGVKIVIDGEKKSIEKFIRDLKEKAPPVSNVSDVDIREIDAEFENDFIILESDLSKESEFSLIPPDIGICEDCKRELLDPRNRRYLHFFITCTNCGPRFTTIYSLPYDRERTSMKDFEMCKRCKNEYTDPMDRRFHAQTIACNNCGPRVFLSDGKKILLEGIEAVNRASELLGEDKIIAVKGYGGFHIACSAENDEMVLKLRELLGRKQQPFAIMVRDLESLRKIVEFDERAEELLKSYVRPIVILKRKGNAVSEHVAPGLHTLGVMLPYSALHLLLFRKNRLKALVMTSANKPGYPMIIDEKDAFEKLKGIVDYFLFHNRKIVQRCDDSVIGFVGGKETKFRRSRGFVPLPVEVKYTKDKTILSTGADTDVTFCILKKGKAFLSQHIGDTSKHETMDFFKESLQHFIDLFDFDVNAIASDLHPKFSTTLFAKEYSESRGIPHIKVQHHHAHMASLMVEHNMDEMVCITADGFGYGIDGTAWGGEVLYGDFNDFKRPAHLETQPMVGGDLATLYPLRMAAGIVKNEEIYDFLMSRKDKFPHGEKEIEIIFKQLKSKNYQITTSCGRILDAAAAILDICHKRTYEGEPARKLEAIAIGGKYVIDLEPDIKGKILRTSPLLEEIFEHRDKFPIKDLAYSVEEYIARGFAELAIEIAEEEGVKYIGFSGGCAYNNHLLSTIKRIVEKRKFIFLQHEKVPPGDGGISLGQVVIAASSI